METEQVHVPLIRTKLHRPSLPADMVKRAGLLARLGAGVCGSAILVSAPAGYGKSTLISSWLEGCARPGAWLSLDENDNDLQRFLSGLVEAVLAVLPGVLGDTKALVSAPTLPPTPLVAATLINELDRIEHGIIVVLDDIHCIHCTAVHEFLCQILNQPPRSMQLVLVGRRDPVVPIASLRAKGLLTEIRMHDLRFTVAESSDFLQSATRKEIDGGTVNALAKKAEGWVTGLRLAVLAMRGADSPGRELLVLKGTTRYVIDYLVCEVLDRQPAGIRDFLLGTSILNRFCASLCDAVLERGVTPPSEEEIDGQAFVEWLREYNLFTIPLDTESRWFRYHHLFGDLLRAQLGRATVADEIAALHSRASTWYEAHGLIEDSIQHALRAGDAEGAADIVERHRDAEFDANRWYIAARWLELLPDQIKRQRPKLLLTRARVLNDQFRLMDIPPVVECAQALVEEEPSEPLVQGELLYFLGFLQFWQGDGRASRAYLDRALEIVPESQAGYLKAQLELFSGLSAYISGQGEEGVERLTRLITAHNLRDGIIWERLTFGLAVIHLLAGELALAYRHSLNLLDGARRVGAKFVETWAKYFLGITAFHGHNLTEARRRFGQVVQDRYVANTRAVIDSMAGSAIASELLGEPDEADLSLRQAQDHARWSEDVTNLEVVRACEARINLLRGELEAVDRWQRGFNLAPQVPGMIFFLAQPSITECRALAASVSDAGLAKADEKLQALRQETASLHYTCQTIDIVALQALVAHRQGRLEHALDLLQQAVDLAAPEEWIRPFVELGPPMAGLLRQLLLREPSAQHAERILAAFPTCQPETQCRSQVAESSVDQECQEPRPTVAQLLPDPLTHRELDVLELLCERLQNKEIAAQLAISPITVKSHLRTIYQKLSVSKRREAVERSKTLGLLE